MEEEESPENVEHPFTCPECGSREAAGECFLSKAPSNSNDPWDRVLYTIDCAKCGQTIPGHLGQRWKDISIEKARKEWRAHYRPTRRTYRRRKQSW
jgi:transcription elongation factor Elf1